MGFAALSIDKRPLFKNDNESNKVVDVSPTLLMNEESVVVKAEERNDGTSSSSSNETTERSDVWYRRFLRPITRTNRPLRYRESFQRRVLQPLGIPVAEADGLHSLFLPTYRRYSPLIGMIFTYNNFVDNLYRYGDPNEPAVQLIHQLFHVLPGGEIQPTHLGSQVGAHFTSRMIGEVFEILERRKLVYTGMNQEEFRSLLAEDFMSLIQTHSDYQTERERLLEDVEKAEAALDELRRRDDNSQPVRDKIKTLEGDVIKKGRHEQKRLAAELKRSQSEQRRNEIREEIASTKASMEVAQKQVDELRLQIVTAAERKAARKALLRAKEMVAEEKASREEFVSILANSFVRYDLTAPAASTGLFLYTTTAILLGYIWRKYNGKSHLTGYFECMERLGALNCSFSTALSVLESSSDSRSVDKHQHFPRRFKEWTPDHVAAAVSTVIAKPGGDKRPPVLQFSYVTWAEYSEFPDCGETALRNLFNQLVYNPSTGRFDYQLLQELKEKHFPNMKSKLINFYKTYALPEDALEHQAAKEWIRVVSGLNKNRSKSLAIRYRREKNEQNIASPLSNLVRVFNALLGVDTVDPAVLKHFVKAINAARNVKLTVDISGIKKDGFGTVKLSDGAATYELQSYKPVHFGFVKLNADGLHDFNTFMRLMRYVRNASRPVRDDTASYFEDVAIASLLVPYEVMRKKTSRFFDRSQLQHVYPLLFADMNTTLQRDGIMCRDQGRLCNDKAFQEWIGRIRDYKEPSFLPAPSRQSSS